MKLIFLIIFNIFLFSICDYEYDCKNVENPSVINCNKIAHSKEKGHCCFVKLAKSEGDNYPSSFCGYILHDGYLNISSIFDIQDFKAESINCNGTYLKITMIIAISILFF